ncbi:restriction endonuclease subunit S [Gymnodinialimonas ceratoperidinii]|uniref:Restriction endonuclease subunit S n=1 Tax=Gymnodinialimonas ceratoperidinii TaxID=2856823 RepID=A0A8F6YBF5_9RHOB|nr:restriction endonuclease subunit S [Gymnodinialimonas ceratoperidinii]
MSGIVGGGTPSKARSDYFEGNIPLMTVKDMKSRRPLATVFNITEEALSNSSAKLVPPDTVIIATRMGLGKVVRASFATAINQDLKALFPAEGVEKSFLEYWLMSISKKIEGLGTGTTVKGIRVSDVVSLPFSLPPVPEQRRIVEKIETLFARLDKGEEAVRQVQALLKRYRQSVLKAAVTGELTADWREANRDRLEHGSDLLSRILKTRRETWVGRGRYKEPAAPDTTGLAELPEGWVWASVDQLSSSDANSLCIGPFGSNLKVEDYRDRGVPLIFVRHIRSKIFRGHDAKFVNDKKAEELSSHRAYPGDLLITKMGDPPGDVCIYPDGLPIAIITADCIRFATSKAGVSREFVVAAMESRLVQTQIREISKGVAQQKVTLANFKKIAIPLPTFEEQKLIAAIRGEQLAKLEKLESWCETELVRSAALRQSILKQAFSGHLVPQDPSDEPASALLARIRAAAPANKTRKANI